MSRRGWWVGSRLRLRRVLTDLRRLPPQPLPRWGWRRGWRRLEAAVRSRPAGPRELTTVVLVLAGGATALAGPVAGLLTAGYAGVIARHWHRHRHQQAASAARADLLEHLTVATANLRAGLPPATALAAHPLAAGPPPTGDAVQRLQRRITAAVRLAERTGAPLAEVIERLEVDARSADRAQATATGQVAGARATTWLLAALPVGGMGLGYVIGADPLSVLLHTPLGAGCALTAFGLQLAGLAWSARITRLDRHLPS